MKTVFFFLNQMKTVLVKEHLVFSFLKMQVVEAGRSPPSEVQNDPHMQIMYEPN